MRRITNSICGLAIALTIGLTSCGEQSSWTPPSIPPPCPPKSHSVPKLEGKSCKSPFVVEKERWCYQGKCVGSYTSNQTGETMCEYRGFENVGLCSQD